MAEYGRPLCDHVDGAPLLELRCVAAPLARRGSNGNIAIRLSHLWAAVAGCLQARRLDVCPAGLYNA